LYLVAPGLVVVVHDGSAEAPRRVDPRAGDRDGRQVDHEHGEPDWQRRKNLAIISLIRTGIAKGFRTRSFTTSRVVHWVLFPYRNVRVAGVALGVGGGEDGVHEHEGADDLGGEPRSGGEPVADLVGAAAVSHVEAALEPLDERDAADGAEALRDHVEERAHQGHLARQEQAERDGRVDVAPRDASGAVDEDEDHAAERPRDAEDAHATARRVRARRRRVRLVLVPDHRRHRDVEEEKRRHELGDHRAVQGPLPKLLDVDERRRRRVRVVTGFAGLQSGHVHFLAHFSKLLLMKEAS
jgi:hypothetical protein